MPVTHISDEQIQDYLDHREVKRDVPLVRHIRQCPDCRARLHQYRMLYRGLKAADEPCLSEDFAANTMRTIRSLPIESPAGNRIGWLQGICVVTPIAAAVIYFFGTSWITTLLGTLTRVSTWQSQFEVFDIVVKGIRSLQDGATIVAAAAVILAGVAVLDKALAKAKLRKISPLSL